MYIYIYIYICTKTPTHIYVYVQRYLYTSLVSWPTIPDTVICKNVQVIHHEFPHGAVHAPRPNGEKWQPTPATDGIKPDRMAGQNIHVMCSTM